MNDETSKSEATAEWDCSEQGHEFVTLVADDGSPSEIECERCLTSWPVGEAEFNDVDVSGGPEQPWDRF